MREILFKAKRKDNGKWVEGDAIHEPIGMSIRHEKNGMSVRVPVEPRYHLPVHRTYRQEW